MCLRVGYEAANHYFYVPLDLVEKVINCEHIRETLESQPADDQSGVPSSAR